MSLEETHTDASATVVIRPQSSTRKFHRPSDDDSLSPACNSSWDGHMLPKRGAESRGFSACERPECFGGEA